MDTDQKQATPAQQALQKAKELIAEGEKQRAQARLVRQVNEFAMGNGKVLLQDEFVRNVSHLIVESFHDGPADRAEMLLEKLGAYACGEDVILRERAVMALSFCSALLQHEENYELLVKVTFMMAQWLKVETTYLPVCDTVCRQLQRNGLKILDEGHWQQFDSLLDILFQIQSGALEKGNVIRGLVARTQDALAVPHILEELAVVCLHSQGARQAMAEKILTHLGRRAVIFLLDKLLFSQKKDERLHLIGLIPDTGKVAVPVLKEYLGKDMPWYGVRNIVLLIAAVGDSSLVPLVLPSLKHDDIRVQQQVVDCINALAGVDTKRYLLSALSVVNDELKPHLVLQLGQLGCTECVDVLLDILAERDAIAPHVRDELLGQLCIVLRLAPQQRTLILLRQLVAEREMKGGGSDSVSLIAKRTLQVLEPQLQPAAKENAGDEVEVSFGSDLHAEQKARLNLRGVEAQIQQLLQENKMAEVTTFIADHAVQAAREKDFVTAEILRDRMMAVNPNALIEVIRVGEIIEDEKSNAISSHHLTIWSDLYDFLDTETFSALYHSQRVQEYQANEVIVHQGDTNATLYFVNTGQIAVTCRHGKKEIFVKRLNPGEIVGAGPFFDISVWTVTLTAMTPLKLQVLERESFLGLLPQHPGLESSLGDFCRRSDNIVELLLASGENRREDIRHAVQLTVVNSLVDSHNNPSPQKFRGKLEDISLSGLSLLIRISKKENARLLLGRHIVSFLPMGPAEEREFRGEIVGVTLLDYVEHDYLVHVCFEQSMSEADLKKILQQRRR